MKLNWFADFILKMLNRNNQKSVVKFLPIYGCISTGMIYLAIGVIAILSFLKIMPGGADESSLIAFLNDSVIGKILIWIILLGTVSYIIWRIHESLKDPYQYGTEAKGILMRIGIGLSTIPDVLIAYSAILIMLGEGNVQKNGQPEGEREMVSTIFKESWGHGVIILVGIIACITALVLLYYGMTRGYRERLDINRVGYVMKAFIHALARAGYFARSIIVFTIGFFFIKAGILEDAQFIVNTDKAFNYIGTQVGHLYFILVAIGTICYGLFMFTLGVKYDASKDLDSQD